MTQERSDRNVAKTFRAPGEAVLLRFIHSGFFAVADSLRFVVPMRVVRDDAELTMLYTAAGSAIRKRVHADGSSIPRDLPYRERAALDMVLGEGIWAPFHTLSIVPAGAAYDVRYVWHQDDWSFGGWYVNLQAPFRRVALGFDSDDWLLDLTVAPDGSWEWKDSDELDDAVAVGVVTEAFARSVRAVGESVIPNIEAGVWPFDGSLIDWRPDPAWTIPAMPENWNEDFS